MVPALIYVDCFKQVLLYGEKCVLDLFGVVEKRNSRFFMIIFMANSRLLVVFFRAPKMRVFFNENVLNLLFFIC